MKCILLSCFIGISIYHGYAHDSNSAYFKITQKQSTVEIEAEFPWSLRNALLKYNPKLDHAKHKAEFEKSFEQYLKDNLILKNQDGIWP